MPVEDVLVLVDPDAPSASALVARSVLVGELYTSVVLCRDLYMYTGAAMRVALHAHALLATCRPRMPDAPTAGAQAAVARADFEAQLRRQYLGRAFQCGACGFGPIDHFACSDLQAHNGEVVGNAAVDNSCPRCGWFTPNLRDWDKWDGTIPPEADADDGAAAESKGGGAALLPPLEANSRMWLRLCYSARRLMGKNVAQPLVTKLAEWEETLTTADGVDHPAQVLLAMALMVDEVPDDALATTPLLTLLNEAVARAARDHLRMNASDGDLTEPNLRRDASRLVAKMLSVSEADAPQCQPLETAEPTPQAVRESCPANWVLRRLKSLDFEQLVLDATTPLLNCLGAMQRLRGALAARGGGWERLEQDMETGPAAYQDVLDALGAPPKAASAMLGELLGVEGRPKRRMRVLATMVAQGLIHHSSALRRTVEAGGNLRQPLGDVRDGETLRQLVRDLHMDVYMGRVAEKMRQWKQVGASLTYARARAMDIGNFAHLISGHAHSLDKATFWGLWQAAQEDGVDSDKVRYFLSKANDAFAKKWAEPGVRRG